MEKPPSGVAELYTVVNHGEAFSVNVMGMVSDRMPASHTRGTDVQMTFVLIDNSVLQHGLRFKFFKKTVDELPHITQRGDIVLLRKVKIRRYMNELIGMSSTMTEHVVFPNASGHYRKSVQGPEPSSHEKKWALSLKESLKHVVVLPEDSSKAAAAVAPASQAPVQVPVRDKFSRIKGISAGDRGSRAGNFYDLAGEVVKMFYNSWGYLDLYLCDYTVNKDLRDCQTDDFDGKNAQRPTGRMTLHIELQQPHAGWTHDNVQEGECIQLFNVRIKWNQKGTGQELEGNLWEDKNYRDRVLVQPLPDTNKRYADIQASKKSYLANIVETPKAETKSSKKRKKNREREAKKAAVNDEEREAKRRKLRDSGIHLEDSDSRDDATKEAAEEGDTEEDEPKVTASQVAKKSINPNVECLHSSITVSTLDDILDSNGRLLVTSDGQSRAAPFNNVKHHARLRVTDFYPHRLRDFAVYEPTSSPSQTPWQWCFWLVLSSADPQEGNEQGINVLVHGRDAEQLLRLQPSDLSRNKQLLLQLEQRLFYLWGDLAEQKDKFLGSHPQIDADESFSLGTYNITAGNRPFDCCIAEYGVQVPLDADDDSSQEADWPWMRLYKLFGTMIKH